MLWLRHVLARTTDPHQFDLRPNRAGAILDVGCGSSKYPSATGIDISAETDADIVHDLDEFPYPIGDDSFDEVLMQDVIEHLAEPIRVMEELHRIARPGARIHVRTPHYSSVLAYGDPTHKHYFSTGAIRSLAEPRFAHYTSARFHTVHVTLDMWTPFRLAGISNLANRFQGPYETYFAFMCPSMNIQAEFEVVK
jgi:SAM-dependent methyltransferase